MVLGLHAYPEEHMSTYIPLIDQSGSDQVDDSVLIHNQDDASLIEVKFGSGDRPPRIWEAILGMLRGG
jgi:hypothetical protein